MIEDMYKVLVSIILLLYMLRESRRPPDGERQEPSISRPVFWLIPTVIRVTRYLRPRAGRLNSFPHRDQSPHSAAVSSRPEWRSPPPGNGREGAGSGGLCSADL